MQNNADRLKKFYKWTLPVFNVTNKIVRAYYREAMPALISKISITDKTTVLDIGTGTGGFAGILLEYTPNITGIDFSPEMLNEARKEYGGRINFVNMAAHEITLFENKSFDLVTSAFCLHDMSNEYRFNVLEQMRRIANEKVIIVDYSKKINLISRAIEFFEGSHYKDYVKKIAHQLNSIFPEFEEIPFLKRYMIIYICDV